MTFAEKIQKHLENNQLKQVIDEFRTLISECPSSEKDAYNDANQLRSQLVVLAGRFNSINDKINLGTASPESANIEKTSIINSFVQILNQLPDTYPDLNNFINDMDEEEAWKEAQNLNTIDGYSRYFKKYPNGKYVAETHRLMKDLNVIKRTQEEEMKRVAQEEKERRDREAKLREKSKPADAPKADNNKVNTTSGRTKEVNPENSGSGINKTLIFASIGVVLFILLMVLLLKSPDNSDTKNPNNSDTKSLTDNGKTGKSSISLNKVKKINYKDPNSGYEGSFIYDVERKAWKYDTGEGVISFIVEPGQHPDASILNLSSPDGRIEFNFEQEKITSVGESHLNLDLDMVSLKAINPNDQQIFDEIFNASGADTQSDGTQTDDTQYDDTQQDDTQTDDTQYDDTQQDDTQTDDTQYDDTQQDDDIQDTTQQ